MTRGALAGQVVAAISRSDPSLGEVRPPSSFRTGRGSCLLTAIGGLPYPFQGIRPEVSLNKREIFDGPGSGGSRAVSLRATSGTPQGTE